MRAKWGVAECKTGGTLIVRLSCSELWLHFRSGTLHNKVHALAVIGKHLAVQVFRCCEQYRNEYNVGPSKYLRNTARVFVNSAALPRNPYEMKEYFSRTSHYSSLLRSPLWTPLPVDELTTSYHWRLCSPPFMLRIYVSSTQVRITYSRSEPWQSNKSDLWKRSVEGCKAARLSNGRETT